MKKSYLFVLSVVGLVLFFSCEKKFDFRGNSEGVYFSSDTVSFDTIFSTFGSTTYQLKVYNPTDEDMIIGQIALAGGEQSVFRLNINGNKANRLQEVRLHASDSLYIFVELTTKDSNSDAPIIMKDSILFQTELVQQYVQLIAHSQDVIVLRNQVLTTQTLKRNRPYVIYDSLIVDKDQVVTVEPGSRLYFYKGAGLYVKGTLLAEGTFGDSIVFASTRIDDYGEGYLSDKPGQWNGIELMPNSGASKFNHVNLMHGIYGLVVDSVGVDFDEFVEIHNSIIQHHSTHGLAAINSSIKSSNCVFARSGNSLVALTAGGNYEFTHCTFTNEPSWDKAAGAISNEVYLSNYYTDMENNFEKVHVPLKKAHFKNCILWGRTDDAATFDLMGEEDGVAESESQYLFDHCLMRVSDEVDVTNESHYKAIITEGEPNFKKKDYLNHIYNYRLDTLSTAKDAGYKEYAEDVPMDILQISRLDDAAPDLGAYERIEEVAKE